MPNKPLVTVIIPAYNEEKYIEKCITSLLTQTYKNVEIIIVNDGSTDSTQIISSKYKVKVISLPHGGPGKAKNYGVNIARGEIVVFLDADMYVDNNYIRNIIQPILDGKTFATYTVKESVANINNLWSRCWNINLDLAINQRLNLKDRNINYVFMAILKNKFLELGGFNPKWGYIDDRSLLTKEKRAAFPVSNAICYHFNPETLQEVFLSARWIGRSIEFQRNINTLIKYSIFNSLKISIDKIRTGAPIGLLLFKIIFDFGIFVGILLKNSKSNYSK